MTGYTDTKVHWWAALWGLLCVTALLGNAVVRLTPYAVDAMTSGELNGVGWGIFVVWVAFNAYAEGYRAFQKKFCPRVVSRALYLGRNPKPLWLLLALPFCMSLFHSTKRQKIVSWVFIIVLVLVIIAVRMMPQPWRGVVDAGVVVGLSWGVGCLWWLFIKAALGKGEPTPTDIPELLEA